MSEKGEFSLGATSQEGELGAGRGKSAIQKIREATIEESPQTVESVSVDGDEDSNPDTPGNKSTSIKISAYAGGTKAENWFEAVMSKLSPAE